MAACKLLDGLAHHIFTPTHLIPQIPHHNISVDSRHPKKDLRDGCLDDNQVVDGSKVTLLPIVETGLMCQKPEQSVLSALESLSDAQVNTFLEGKAPLNLTMRVGDHMMFIQLQLSTVGNGRLNRRQQPSGGGSNIRRPRVASSDGPNQMLDNRTLVQASRNLSQTLKHFSTQSKTSSAATTPSTTPNVSTKEVCRGAIIESMQHHGRGVYSGTFSGTLNPALQDSNGNPKRDISTIIHILNDLLGASSSSHNSVGRRHRVTQTAKAAGQLKTEVSSVELSRETTRGKMEQLQQLLQERRERRRARREAKASPYTSSIITSSSSTSSINSSSISSNWLTSSSTPIVLHQTPPSNTTTTDTNAESADYIQLNSEPVAI